jgi:hypothetical protein
MGETPALAVEEGGAACTRDLLHQPLELDELTAAVARALCAGREGAP